MFANSQRGCNAKIKLNKNKNKKQLIETETAQMTEQTLTGHGVCCVLSSANWKEFLFIAKPNFLWLGLPLMLLLCLQHMLLLLLQGLSVACCCCYSWSCTRCDAAAQGGGHPDMLLLLWTLNP